MVAYTNAEKADMVFMYRRALGNAREAQRFYKEQFPAGLQDF